MRVRSSTVFSAVSLVLLVALVSFASPARAGLLLDPYLGYQIGSADTTYGANSGALSGTSNSLTLNGVAIGARVGFSLPLLFAGLDYSMVNGQIKMPSSTDTMTSNTLWAFAGVHVPFLRAWLGYGILHDLTDKASAGDATFKGSAMKAGVGFTGLPFISLNVEYIISTFNKYKSSTGDEDMAAASTYSSATARSLLFSVSLPLDF